MNTSRTLKATIAAATAGFIALGPAAGGATAVSSPASAPTEPSTAPVDVGQSVQLRVDADGAPNSDLVDFRWSVTQITIPGGDIPETVTYPDQGIAVRSLDDFAEPTDNGNGTVTAPVDNHGTWGSVRTVGLMPQDFKVPVELTTKFTLNGETVTADEMIGADGLVTTEYCIKNLSTKTMEVPITTLGGQQITEKVKAQVPMVAQASTLIPQRYVDLNMGAGLGGADGRGNTQAQWIVLPFTPINQDGGKACFGWAANVQDMVLPAMLIQVAPVYIPEEDKDKKEDGGSFGLPTLGKPSGGGPDLSAGKNEIVDGIGKVLEAMQGIANNRASGGDPLQNIGDALTAFFDDLGIKIVDVSEGLNGTIRKTDKTANTLENLAPRFKNLGALLKKVQDALPKPLIDLLEVLADADFSELEKTLSEADANISDILDNEELIKNLEFWGGVLAGDPDPITDKIDCTVPKPSDDPRDGFTIGVGAWDKNQIEEDGLTYAGYEPWGVNNGGPFSPDWQGLPDPAGYGPTDALVVHGGIGLGEMTEAIYDGLSAAQKPVNAAGETVAYSELKNYGVVYINRSNKWEVKSPNLVPGVGPIKAVPSGYLSTYDSQCTEQRDALVEFRKTGTAPEEIASFINFLNDTPQILLPEDIKEIGERVKAFCANRGNPCVTAAQVRDLGEILELVPGVLTKLDNLIVGALGIVEKLPTGTEAEDIAIAIETLRDSLGSFAILSDLANTVGNLLDGLGGTLTKLNTAMIDLQVTLAGAGDKLSKSQVNLPTTAAVVSDLVEKALQTPNAQLLLSGLDETKAGFGLVASELGAFIGDVIAQISAAVASIKAKIPGAKAGIQNAIAELNAKVNTLKGDVGGMIMAAHQSPLPYGGNPADAPEGTQLAGAYEFRLDAADHNTASTPARYVIGLLALFAAGGIGVLLARRGAA
jgi:hypothetical protein